MPLVTKQKQLGNGKPQGSALDRIERVQDRSSDRLIINLYGRNGTGKTSLACTFPKPLLLVGCEDGTKSVADVDGVDFILVRATEEIHELTAEAASSGRWQTVVLDTATSLQDLVLKEILGLDEMPVQLEWGTASMDQYRSRSEKTKELLRKFVDLPEPINVVILAQEKNHTSRDDEGGGEAGAESLQPFIASALGKSTAGWLCERADFICQTFVREEVTRKTVKGIGGKTKTVEKKTGRIEFCLRSSKAHPIYAAKIRASRSVVMPDVISDPSWAKLVAAIRGQPQK